VLFWGTSFAAIKTAMGSFSPMMVMWLRMMVATAVFAPFWRRVPPAEYRSGDWRLLALAVAFIPCAYYTLEGFAIQFTTSSQAGVISATAPLLVAAGAWVFLKERLSWQSAVGIGVSIVGVAILSLSSVSQEAASAPALGNLLELGAMVAAAGSMITVKHLSTRYDPWFLTGLQAAVGVVWFAPLALLSGPTDWSAVTPAAWGAIFYLGTFASLGAFGLYNNALKLMPAAKAALAINLSPAVALLTGWLVLDETLAPVQLAACAVIVGAVVFAELSGRAPAEEPVAP
jgi:drug/metabolite transporter (DMT)-like permease